MVITPLHLGAAGGIGQPLSLLLKIDPKVSELSLFDVRNTPGVAADISHCNSPAKVISVSILRFSFGPT
jgi:malate dehydrogenase